MRARIGGVLTTEIYATDDGFVALEQSTRAAVVLAPDEVLVLIRELQSFYDRRAEWQEPERG